jgi:hypothetical protein
VDTSNVWETIQDSTEPTAILIETIRDLNGTFAVNQEDA